MMAQGRRPGSTRLEWILFLAGFSALYFELFFIRYLSTEIRIFAYYKNLPLIASFLGIGLGMILGRTPPRMSRSFPLVTAGLFLLMVYSERLGLTHLIFNPGGFFIWGGRWTEYPSMATLGFVYAVLASTVAFFVVLGGWVGESLQDLPPLRGYGVNLLGAVIGGVLENLVIVGGTPILRLLAIVLFALSALFLIISTRRKQALISPVTESIAVERRLL